MGHCKWRALRVFQVVFQVISRDCIAQSNAKELGFERHRADCGASIEKGRGSPAFGTLQVAGLAGVSSGFQVISRDCISQSNAKEFEL
ncbi:hypothetical protein [Anaeromassilibacillus sp. SJQ-1]|uniref:hypothetical protein n=1 Tax=Anaeromassilibacillus sp. SJQ-1 TaxID=3375419 RepID=UPI003989152A